MKKIRWNRIIMLMLLMQLLVLPAFAEQEQVSTPEEAAQSTGTIDEMWVPLRFSGFVYPGEYETDILYSDRYFLEDARVYNHRLAQLSMATAVASFRWDFDDDPQSFQYIDRFLRQMEFTDVSLSDYEKHPSLYTIASCIARKEIVTEEDSFTLVAVAVCGGNYTVEWASNLTVGTGERHEGFNTAAELVENRIMGYLAREGLIGKKVKLWISGFSRAAAVANITAADITSMNLIPASDIFSYNFATPRTTRGDAGNYENIFNIIGKQDPVPRFTPADWGFVRYGRDLYTPSQETDADYIEREARVEVVFEDLIEAEWWNNPGSDLDLRLFYEYMVQAFPTQEDFARIIQDSLASLVEDKSLTNIMRQLHNILSNPETTEEQKEHIRSFMTYVVGMAAGDMLKSGEQALDWRPGALISGNAVHEHCLEVYLSWMLSSDDPDEIFTESPDWLRIYTKGLGEYVVMDRDSGTLIGIWSYEDRSFDMMERAVPEFSLEKADLRDFYYITEDKNHEEVLILPCDGNYDVWFCSKKEQKLSNTVSWFPSFQEREVRIATASIPAKEEAVLLLNTREVQRQMKEKGEEHLSADDLSTFLQLEPRNRLGKVVLTIAIAGPGVVLVLLVLAVVLIVRHKRRKKAAESR